MSTRTYRLEAVVKKDGVLTLEGLPFRAGAKVKVIVLGPSPHRPQREERYPLRGQPIRYQAPFDSVAEDEWEVLR